MSPRRPVSDLSRLLALGLPLVAQDLRGLKRISGLTMRLLAICCISATVWFSVSQRGLRRHRGVLGHAHMPGAAPAFGESCRRRGHAPVSLTDPKPSCRKRQSDMKDSPIRIVGRCLKGPTVGLDDGPTNRQPHPHPIGFRREEGVEDAVHVARIDSRA
jgi:hypothetical protein